MLTIRGPAILGFDPVWFSHVIVCVCVSVSVFGFYPSCQCLVRTASVCQMREVDPPARGCALMLPGLLLVLHNKRPEFLCHCFSVRERKHFSVKMDLSVDATARFQLTACRWNANFLPWCRLLFVAVTAGALLVLSGLPSLPSVAELLASSPPWYFGPTVRRLSVFACRGNYVIFARKLLLFLNVTSYQPISAGCGRERLRHKHR